MTFSVPHITALAASPAAAPMALPEVSLDISGWRQVADSSQLRFIPETTDGILDKATAQRLALAIQAGEQGMVKVDLSDLDLAPDALGPICSALATTPPGRRGELHMKRCAASPQAIDAIAAMIKDCRGRLVVDLEGVQLTGSQLRALLDALVVRTGDYGPITMGLDRTGLANDEGEMLAAAIGRVACPLRLWCSNNRIGSGGATPIAKALATRTGKRMIKIDLWGNVIGDQALTDFRAADRRADTIVLHPRIYAGPTVAVQAPADMIDQLDGKFKIMESSGYGSYKRVDSKQYGRLLAFTFGPRFVHPHYRKVTILCQEVGTTRIGAAVATRVLSDGVEGVRDLIPRAVIHLVRDRSSQDFHQMDILADVAQSRFKDGTLVPEPTECWNPRTQRLEQHLLFAPDARVVALARRALAQLGLEARAAVGISSDIVGDTSWQEALVPQADASRASATHPTRLHTIHDRAAGAAARVLFQHDIPYAAVAAPATPLAAPFLWKWIIELSGAFA